MEGDYFRHFSGKYKNIIGVLQGNDPVLKDEYIVVGAHYDHLGYKLDKDGDTIVYNGADDNASGVATLIELGRMLKELQPQLQRSVILVAFDAEEIGLYGSQNFVDKPFVPINKIKLMLSVDMVGWYKKSGYIKYSGAGTIYNGKDLLSDKSLIPEGLHVSTQNFEKSIFTATDTEAFARAGIPTLAVTTGIKSPYHKPGDDAELIDYDGMTLITNHLVNFVKTVSKDEDYRASGKLASKHSPHQKKILFGVTANIGSNYHHYTAGAMDGKPATSFNIGLMSQINMGVFAIRPEVYYEHIQANHPEGKISTDNITVPLNLVLQTSYIGSSGVDVFLGGYYSYRFDGKQNFADDYTRNEVGFNYGFSFRMAKIKVGYTRRSAFTNFSGTKNADNAHLRNRANFFAVSYLF
jgi:hypothetical protein